MSLGSLASRLFKFGEANVIGHAASAIAAHAPAIESQLPAEIVTAATVAANDLVAAVERVDGVLGPAGSALVNGTITAYKTQIVAELETILTAADTKIVGFVPKVVAAMQTVAAKLHAEAQATV